MTVRRASLGRCLLVWLVVTSGCAAILRALSGDLLALLGLATGSQPSGLAAGGFEALLTSVAAAALAGCAVWVWLVTCSVVVEALRGVPSPPLPPRRAGNALAGPDALRRWLFAACGLALATGLAVPAHADIFSPAVSLDHRDPAASPAARLTGLPVPDRAVTPGPGLRRVEATPGVARVIVRPGDTLWDLAAARLPAGARSDDSRVSTAWQQLYAANRHVVGADPDLIHPGTTLDLPARLVPPSPLPPDPGSDRR